MILVSHSFESHPCTEAGGDRWRSHISPICFHCFGFFGLAELFHVLRKWLRGLDFCNALSEPLSLSDFCVAAPPDSGWHGALRALARGSVQI